MHIKLQRELKKKFLSFLFFPLLLVAAPGVGMSQSVLSPGDLVITRVHSGSPGYFDFAPLVDLEKGTVIYFTDNAYVSTTQSLSETESTVTYTAPEAIPAGIVLSYTGAEDNGFAGTEFEAKGSGDNLIVYQISGSDTTFLYGAGWGGGPSVWTYNGSAETEADAHSDIPPGLGEAAHTLIHLGAGQNHRYDNGKGMEGIPGDIAERVGNKENWITGLNVFSGLDAHFTVLNPPVLRFSASSVKSSGLEDEVVLSVELIETGNTAVSADIVFAEDLSTVSLKNIRNYSTRTVNFSAADTAGTTKSVSVNLVSDESYEEGKTAVFRLQNNTAGSIAAPAIMEVEIEGNDVPDIVINEINADPGGDANGISITDSPDDEFIEFVNNEHAEIDISGWTFSDDGSTVRHVFPPGTVLPASGALVLFANEGVKPAGNFRGAIVQNSNASPILDLDDRGDTPTLKNTSGRIVARYSYGPEAGDAQSITRAPDITGQFVKHSSVAASGGLPSSPGARINGASFRSMHAINIHGSEGWRMIAAPVQNTSFSDLLGEFRMQGIAGSEAPTEDATIYYWDEPGGTLVKPPDMTDELLAARGYLVYFFEDDEYNVPGVQGGFPKRITPDHEQSRGPISVAVSATDANGNDIIDQNEGYNLLGNPFGVNISVTAVLDALENVDESMNRNMLVWNHAAGGGNGAYTVLTDGDYLAPFQAFFVKYTAEMSGNVMFNKAELQPGGTNMVYREPEERNFGFDIKLSNENYFDTYHIAFRQNGVAGRDRWDAYKLFSLNPNSINLFSSEGGNRLLKNVLPTNLSTVMEIPLTFEAPDDGSSFEFSWKGIDQLPEGWKVVLKDEVLGREMDLSTSSNYDFTSIRTIEQNKITNEKSLINKTKSEMEDPRFLLSVIPPSNLISAADDPSESVKLNPNYPNPFNSFTIIPFELPPSMEAHIELSIWNIVGQKVATLIDEVRDEGDDVRWNAADMPSGIYIAQLEVEGKVYIRKMTLIK